ncbi:MAG: ATPase, T2SS/T4P/T4SS family [Gemmatimonadales bacterium]
MFRIDGVLQEVMKPPIRLKAALISRIKILSQLNIAERRIPQDGRLKLKMGNKVIDFRVSTLPCLFGEKIVCRILDKGNLTLDLTKFGFEPKAEQDLMSAILNPYGMVLVTGPTGSGKTTTLYSALQRINTIETNIMTAEDPVEYNLMGINQVQVRPEIGLTFAAALKAFLRQDPNVIMIGEIRDLETGGIGIKAALTGHLVLSTLHTNDAPSTITRMVDTGTEQFNVAAAVNLVAAQRLVRRICSNRKGPAKYKEEELKALGDENASSAPAVPERRLLRYVRRHGLQGLGGSLRGHGHEPRTPADDSPGGSVAELREQAVKDGMLTSGWTGQEIERGVTTLEEVVKETLCMSDQDTRLGDVAQGRRRRQPLTNLRALLQEMIEYAEAFDLHVTAGERPKLRIDGDITDRSVDHVLSPKDTLQLAYSVLTESQKKQLLELEDELDFSFGDPEPGPVPRQRVQAARLRVAMVLRMIPFSVRTFNELGCRVWSWRLAERPCGPILVTGADRLGQPTTLAAVIDKINKERKSREASSRWKIRSSSSTGTRAGIVNQREIGTDTKSFSSALKYAPPGRPRRHPRRRNAGPGDHCRGAHDRGNGPPGPSPRCTTMAESINRMIDVFLSNQQSQIRAQLAFVLEGVVTQTLLQRNRGRAGHGLRDHGGHAGPSGR